MPTTHEIAMAKQANRQPSPESVRIRKEVEALAKSMGFPGFDAVGYKSRGQWAKSVYEAHVVLCRDAKLSYPDIGLAWGGGPAGHVASHERHARVKAGRAAQYTMRLVETIRKRNQHGVTLQSPIKVESKGAPDAK